LDADATSKRTPPVCVRASALASDASSAAGSGGAFAEPIVQLRRCKLENCAQPKSAVDERLRAADEESMSADEVAKAFIPHYYNLFDTNREGLVSLFRETSSLTFEGDGPKTGVAQIMEKLRGLPPARDGATRKLVRSARARARGRRGRRPYRAPAAQVAHQPQTIECQPSVSQNAILVFCTGQIMARRAASALGFVARRASPRARRDAPLRPRRSSRASRSSTVRSSSSSRPRRASTTSTMSCSDLTTRELARRRPTPRRASPAVPPPRARNGASTRVSLLLPTPK